MNQIDTVLQIDSQPDSAPEKPMSLLEASQLAILNPAELSFFMKGIHLHLSIEGKGDVGQINVFRAYPLSDPMHYLSICNKENEEIGVLMDPGELSESDRVLVKKHLDRRYLVPIVSNIISTKERFGTLEWTMDTDRGMCTFTTRNLREYSFQPSPGRLLIEDVDGNRYDIRDVKALSKKSQDLLLKYM